MTATNIQYGGLLPTEYGTRHFVYDLPEGMEGAVVELENHFIRIGAGGGPAWVCARRCDHSGGRLALVPGGAGGGPTYAVCPRHGWKLNMNGDRPEYDNGVAKETVRFEMLDSGKVRVIELAQRILWQHLFQTKWKPTDKFSMTLLSHACFLIEIDGVRILTDPWLTGPAFLGGWWLDVPPTWKAIEMARSADVIYISHEHPDHFSPQTLVEFGLLEKPIICPIFQGPGGDRLGQRLRALGASNVHEVPCALEATSVLKLNDNGLWCCLFKSGDYRHDSGLFIGIGDTGILLCVDSGALNNFELPECVTVMASSFAGGASGHPVMWEGDREAKYQLAKTKLFSLKALAVQHAKACSPLHYIPYAGYFKEADPDVAAGNPKNTAREVAEAVAALPGASAPVPLLNRESQLTTWIFDSRGFREVAPALYSLPTYETGFMAYNYRREQFEAVESGELAWDVDAVASYLKGPKNKLLGFSPPGEENLNVYVVPVSEDWKALHQHLGLVVTYMPGGLCRVLVRPQEEVTRYFSKAKEPPALGRHLLMRVRVPAMMRVVREGLPLEEIAIGFQAKFGRVGPYNATFWHYFNTQQEKQPVKHSGAGA